ncbi:MAG: rhodanese-like domain-containing protein [Marinilabiliales bacterium]|nr:rhodanese-like domain-containing protein [Marinilabiliales bacterium]
MKIWLPALAVLLVLTAYWLRPDVPGFKEGTKRSIPLVTNDSQTVLPEALAGKTLIDLRPEEMYLTSHPAQAISLPARQILEPASLEILGDLLKANKEVVLFGTTELQAVAPWMLLQQLGYSGIKRLKGGYHIPEGFVETPADGQEVSRVDGSLLKKQEHASVPEPATTPATTQEKVVPVKRAPSAHGGC